MFSGSCVLFFLFFCSVLRSVVFLVLCGFFFASETSVLVLLCGLACFYGWVVAWHGLHGVVG